MSLQVWLPLNGHIKNYGLSGASTSLVNAPAVINSNRGECYNFNPNNENNQGIELIIPEMPQWIQNEISISFWAYHRESSGRSIFFGNHSIDGTLSFNIEKNTSNQLRIYMNSDPDFSVTKCTMEENTWIHIAITKTPTELKVYKNGVCVQTRTNTADDSWSTANGTKYRIGRDSRSDATALNGMMSDFRIYDHALSQKEIVELSQGLILHYPLSSPYMTKTTNLFSLGSLTHHGSSWTELPEKFMGEAVYNNKVTTPSVSNNAGFRITAPINLPSAPTATTITLSFYKRLNQVYGKNLGGYLTLKNAAGTTQRVNWTYNIANWANDSSSLGKWQKITATATITLTDASQIQYMYVYTDNTTGGSCDFSHIQLEYGNIATAYTGFSREAFIEDVSGYKRHGVIIDANNGLLSDDTRKGKYSLNLDGATGEGKRACVKGNLNLENLKTFTVSAFVKLRTWGAQDSGFFCLNNNVYNDSNNYQKSPMHHRDSYFDISALGHTSGATESATYKRLQFNSGDVAANSDWVHVAVTYNGQKATLYIDGVEKRAVSFDAVTILQPCKEIGLSYSVAGGVQRVTKANWSDFRVYSTALSAAAIKNLADKEAAIDPDGNYYSFSLDEEFEITHNLSTTGIMNAGVDYDFVNMYPGVQSTTKDDTVGITYNYETDIFKEYGFNTCTKFTAKKTTTTDKFLAYSYIMPIYPYTPSAEYTFSCYAYMPSSCNADLRIHLENSTTWVKNYQGTTSNIVDTTKDQVIKVWGTIKANSSGLMYLMFCPNPNTAGVFTRGEFYIAGITVYKGNTHQHPVNQAFSGNLIKTMVAGGRTTLNGTHSIIADFSQNADTYARFNFYEPLDFDKTYQLSFNVSNFPSGSKWTWNLFNKSQYSFLVDRNGTYYITFKPKASYMATSDLQDMLFDDGSRTTPTGKVNFDNFKIVECLGGSNHAIFETNKSAIHPEYVEMNRYYEFI